MNSQSEAEANLENLRSNSYVGRGIILGVDYTGKKLIQVYWIMGRSENSRNRVFEKEGERVFTVAADPSKLKDPSLIIYNAMDRSFDQFVVSNGDQTDTVISSMDDVHSFKYALHAREYEPDRPNFTPRITGICVPDQSPLFQISLLRKSPWDMSCERHLFTYDTIPAGFGMCVTTYTGDGDPLPSFVGEPKILPLTGKYIKEVGENIWEALDKENRISLAVKYINRISGRSDIKLFNKYKKV